MKNKKFEIETEIERRNRNEIHWRFVQMNKSFGKWQ